jgi:YHS domain-containing protein
MLGALAIDPIGSRGSTTERIVTDWHTGLAIGGYDPVAFYTDRHPILGAAEMELAYGGAVWRFANIGNRGAFAAHPEVYMPKFGGYDPIGVAHGVAVPGNPEIWTIVGESLFLFHDQSRLQTFSADPERFTGAAERKWPDVLQTLSP